MMIKLCLFILIGFFSFNSCDILRFSPFEVVFWAPGEGYHSEPENIIISLEFSHNPHTTSVERNFSLTADGNRVRGSFRWEGKKMFFCPLTPLERNADYAINLSAEARNTEGLSMDEAFFRSFTTRAGNSRPEIISYYPSMYEVITESRARIKLEFSLPVPLKSLYENISFVPSMTGLWLLENDGKLAIFTPSEPWIQNTRYEIRISSSFTDNNGMNIRNEFSSIFITGADREIPLLLYAQRITKDGEVIPLVSDRGFAGAAEFPVENQDWEKDDRFLLVFSKPVDGLLVRNHVNVEQGSNLIMETFPGFKTEFIFRFETPPVYESRFTLRIRPGIRDISGNETKEEVIFRIFANGKFSKPPALAGIRIPMSPNNDDDDNDDFDFNTISFKHDSLFGIIPITDDDYPSGESINTWIELYFDTAQGASIELFSLMELFRVNSTNNVITFSPRQMKADDFTICEPEPGWENLHRVEISGNLTNTTNFGIINFQIAAGLKDSLGNINDKLLNISLIK